MPASRVEGWSDTIVEKRESTQSGIPSPSNMTWDYIDKVLIGKVPKFEIADLPECDTEELEETRKLFSFADRIISANSEADASSRVIILLIQVLKSYPEEKQAKFQVVHRLGMPYLLLPPCL